jgi:hypothetical protein
MKQEAWLEGQWMAKGEENPNEVQHRSAFGGLIRGCEFTVRGDGRPSVNSSLRLCT